MKFELTKVRPTFTRHLTGFLLLVLLLLACLTLSACSDEVPGMSRSEAASLTMADFTGAWYTVLPNGEKWQLVLHADGRFESLPIRSNRGTILGRWSVRDGGFVWSYAGGPDTGGVSREINPIILKTDDKFMLSEKMGMTSTYTREP